MKTKFLVVDGMDGAGKSTFIHHIVQDSEGQAKTVNFKKTLPSGALLRITEEKDFELLFSSFELFDQRFTYVLDRFIVSNLVYDKILRGVDTSVSSKYYAEFKSRFNVMEVFLTRPPINTDFVDDRISMTVDQFNRGIEEYRRYGVNYDILTRDELGRPNGTSKEIDLIRKLSLDFIRFY